MISDTDIFVSKVKVEPFTIDKKDKIIDGTQYLQNTKLLRCKAPKNSEYPRCFGMIVLIHKVCAAGMPRPGAHGRLPDGSGSTRDP